VRCAVSLEQANEAMRELLKQPGYLRIEKPLLGSMTNCMGWWRCCRADPCGRAGSLAARNGESPQRRYTKVGFGGILSAFHQR
jgi:hypothetical protein